MGKMKRGRHKLHAAAKKSKAKETSSTGEAMVVDVTENIGGGPEQSPFLPQTGSSNPFRGLGINMETLKQKLPDLDARSTITSKSFKGLGLKKKDKHKVRHQLWMEKLNCLEAEKARQKERRRKQKTPVVGDLTGLQETLPTLELLLKKTTGKPQHTTKPTAKPKGIEKETKRRKRMLADINLFKQVICHPAYKENPEETIAQHLQNKMQQSETEDQGNS